MRNKYEVRGDVTAIFLNRRKGQPPLECIVDTSDLPKLLSLDVRWCGNYHKGMDDYYVIANKSVNGEIVAHYKMHRFITDAEDGLVVDHRDGKTLNNRRYNLRCITQSANTQNRIANRSNVTGVRGVTFMTDGRSKPYRARVRYDGKVVYNKHFSTKEEAEQAVLAARKKFLPFSEERRDKVC